MPRSTTVRQTILGLNKSPKTTAMIVATSLIVTNGTIATIIGVVIGISIVLVLAVVSALLIRAASKVDDQTFERTVYLLKLISLYTPRILSAGPSKQVTDACVAAVTEQPPTRPRVPHCPECLLHGEGLKH